MQVKLKTLAVKKEKDFRGPKPAGKAGGGEIVDFNKISQDRKKVSKFNNGGIARGCGAVRGDRRKKTKFG